MASTFDIGDVVRVRATFTQDDVAIDPTTVTLVVLEADGTTSTTYTYAGSTVTRSSVGVYYVDVTVGSSDQGTWYTRWTTTGTGACSEESWFEVKPRRVP